MKKFFIILTFLGVWFWIAHTLLQVTWWQTHLYQFVAFFLSIMVGMSIGATVAILALSLVDHTMDKLYALLAENPFPVEG